MTRTITYVLADPTGNLTILVETDVPIECQPDIAAQLMVREPAAEQVGFVSEGAGCDIALRMAGGEFCGNAAMSAAILSSKRTGLEEGSVLVRVSGAEAPVRVDVQPQAGGVRRARAAMPRPLDITGADLPGAGSLPVVRFSGISHVICRHAPDRAEAERLAPVWCGALGAEALGILFYEQEENLLTPLVFVPAAGTLRWERSCASGAAALGAYLAAEAGGTVTASPRQPGGILTVEAGPDTLTLSGAVRLLRRSTADVTQR